MDAGAPQGAEIAREKPLRLFVGKLLSDWDDGDRGGIEIDGFEMQEVLERSGLLTKERRTEVCGEHCACAEYLGPTEHEEWDCYKMAPLAMKLREEYRAAIAASGGAKGNGNG